MTAPPDIDTDLTVIEGVDIDANVACDTAGLFECDTPAQHLVTLRGPGTCSHPMCTVHAEFVNEGMKPPPGHAILVECPTHKTRGTFVTIVPL